jgi:cytochrome d ubiquinol oxidase subunit II
MAVFVTVILAAHGVTYLKLKTEGPVHDRSAAWAKRLWIAAGALLVVVSIESWDVRPDLVRHAIHNPFCWLGLLILAGSIFALASGRSAQRELRAFVASNVLLAGLLVTGTAALFPVMLYSTLAPENSLTAYGVAASHSALILASIWWPVGFALATSYFIFISRRYAGKVSIKRDTQGFY